MGSVSRPGDAAALTPQLHSGSPPAAPRSHLTFIRSLGSRGLALSPPWPVCLCVWSPHSPPHMLPLETGLRHTSQHGIPLLKSLRKLSVALSKTGPTPFRTWPSHSSRTPAPSHTAPHSAPPRRPCPGPPPLPLRSPQRPCSGLAALLDVLCMQKPVSGPPPLALGVSAAWR